MCAQQQSGGGVNKAELVLGRIWRDVFVNWLAASPLLINPVRALLLRMYGIRVPSHGIRPLCFFGGRDIWIGEGSFVNYRCFFDGSAPIRIGRNCGIGMEVLFCTSGHDIAGPAERAGHVHPKPITVGDGCWVGARSVLLPGVTVGDGCIVAAGAVVIGECMPNGLYAGVPARRVKELPVGEKEDDHESS